jgi:hypothetical protein
MMKAIGAGTVAATIGSTTASAAADKSFWTATDGVYDPFDPSVSSLGAGFPILWSAAWVADTIWDEINENPDSGDDVILHSQATSAAERKQSNEILWDNYLTEMHTLANIEARHAIASAWESGKNTSTAYADAITAIRSYYEPHEVNLREMLAQIMLDLGSVSDARDGTESDSSIAPWVNDSSSYTGSGTDVHCRITAANYTETKTITLHNGTEYEMGVVPHFRFYVRDASDSYEVPFDEVISQYDTSGDTVTITGDSQDWTTSLQFSVPNVPDADLPGDRVFDFSEWLEIYNEIESQSDMVAGNYSETFVSDIYAELDAGNIDPSDVRGVEGQVRFMSGTEGATETSYRMALMQQLDMSQADMSKVASMKVTYSGYTGLTYDTVDGSRRRILSDEVTDEQYEGQLFANDIPDAGLSVGDTYAARNQVILSDPDDSLAQLYPDKAAINDLGANGSDPAISPDGNHVLTKESVNQDHKLRYIDVDTGEILWTASFTNINGGPIIGTDGKVYLYNYNGTSDELVALNPSDGSRAWSVSKSFAGPMAPHPDGRIGILSSNGGVVLYNPDGTEDAGPFGTTSHGFNKFVFHPDGTRYYCSDDQNNGNLQGWDIENDTELWSTSLSYNIQCISRDGSYFVADDGDRNLSLIETSDGSEVWSLSGTYIGSTFVGSRYIIATDDSGNVEKIPPSDSTAGEVITTHTAGIFGVLSWPHSFRDARKYAGSTGNAVVYDGPSGSEVELPRGSFTVDSMSDADGNDVETTNWDDPDYDTYDAEEYANYTTKVNEYLESIGYWDDSSSSSSGGGGGLFGGNFLENLFAGLSAGAIALVAIGLIALDKLTN